MESMSAMSFLIDDIWVLTFDQEELLHELKCKTVFWYVDQEETKEACSSLVNSTYVSNEK